MRSKETAIAAIKLNFKYEFLHHSANKLCFKRTDSGRCSVCKFFHQKIQHKMKNGEYNSYYYKIIV